MHVNRQIPTQREFCCKKIDGGKKGASGNRTGNKNVRNVWRARKSAGGSSRVQNPAGGKTTKEAQTAAFGQKRDAVAVYDTRALLIFKSVAGNMLQLR